MLIPLPDWLFPDSPLFPPPNIYGTDLYSEDRIEQLNEAGKQFTVDSCCDECGLWEQCCGSSMRMCEYVCLATDALAKILAVRLRHFGWQSMDWDPEFNELYILKDRDGWPTKWRLWI